MVEKLPYGENETKRKAQCYSATIAVKAQMLEIKLDSLLMPVLQFCCFQLKIVPKAHEGTPLIGRYLLQ